MLPPAEKFSSRVRKLGLGDGHRVICYDQNNYLAAPRVWWMFRTMGHADVAVLDGGFEAWRQAGGPVEDLPPISSPTGTSPCARAATWCVTSSK